MVIKKFQGKTEAEATEAARKELGDAVVIMNAKSIKRRGFLGLFRSPIVEVMVAMEEENDRPAPKAPTMNAISQLAAKQKEINDKKAYQVPPSIDYRVQDETEGARLFSENVKKDAFEEKLDSLETLLKKKLEGETDNSVETESVKEEEKPKQVSEVETERMKFTKLLYNKMIDNEVNEKYANAIIEEAEKAHKPNLPFDYMLSSIYQKMILMFGTPVEIIPAARGPKVVYFVGPTGVGKTTTIAKIASKLCVEQKKRVALLTADTYRIAAAEQLRTYANILEIPFRIVYSAGEIEQAYEEFHDYDYVLVDTAGHSHHNEEQKNNTNVMIHAVDKIAESEVYLVLSATTKYRDLISIADTYKEMSDYSIIFTKLDETSSFGNLLNLKLYTGCELSYVTYGQNVPDDIDRFNPQTTVKSILGGN